MMTRPSSALARPSVFSLTPVVWPILILLGIIFRQAWLRYYVQPRRRKIRNRIGIGMPRSQRRMYPVAPISWILCLRSIVLLPPRFAIEPYRLLKL
jgi:hypothetical protein